LSAANASISIASWNEFSADPKSFGEASREHYARLDAQPGAMHAGFSQFAAFDQDIIDNKAFLAHGKLTMPLLAVGGEKSFGPTMAVVMRPATTDVQEQVIPKRGGPLIGRRFRKAAHAESTCCVLS
jgi:hypothetical protein